MTIKHLDKVKLSTKPWTKIDNLVENKKFLECKLTVMMKMIKDIQCVLYPVKNSSSI